MLNVIGSVGTGKNGCTLSMLSALYSSSITDGIVHTIKQIRWKYMEQCSRDIVVLLDAKLANAYERCIQLSKNIRVLNVARTHKALDLLEDRITKGIPGQHVTAGCTTERTANPPLQKEIFTIFLLYQLLQFLKVRKPQRQNEKMSDLTNCRSHKETTPHNYGQDSWKQECCRLLGRYVRQSREVFTRDLEKKAELCNTI